MDITLPPDLEAFIEARVARDGSLSSSDVISEALRLLKVVERADDDDRDRLCNAYREGIESGDAGELDFETLKREARASFLARP